MIEATIVNMGPLSRCRTKIPYDLMKEKFPGANFCHLTPYRLPKNILVFLPEEAEECLLSRNWGLKIPNKKGVFTLDDGSQVRGYYPIEFCVDLVFGKEMGRLISQIRQRDQEIYLFYEDVLYSVAYWPGGAGGEGWVGMSVCVTEHDEIDDELLF